MIPNDCAFRELAHTADIGFRIEASEFTHLFYCAAVGMFHLMGVAPDREAPLVVRRFALESIDKECLMVDWLSELLYLYETTGVCFDDVEFEVIEPQSLVATVGGHSALEQPVLHIKAATFHQLHVDLQDGVWIAEVFFDI